MRVRKPGEGCSSNPSGFRSRSRQRGARPKRIFVIRQRIQLPPTDSAREKNLQQILVFDDHPESLRLLFGDTTAKLDHPRPLWASSWQIILLSILVICLLTAILWVVL
ncbi:MAG TPA: hypothetical protein VGH08_03525 [Chthoniobacterales bacterium]|jgi:hypothetical protein